MKKSKIILKNIEEEFSYASFGVDNEVLEIPADFILYQILKIDGFQKIITDEDIRRYTESLTAAYHKNNKKLPDSLAIHYPYANYHTELFKEISLENKKNGFILRRVSGKKAKTLQEYRLARLEILSKECSSCFSEIVDFAKEQYKMKTETKEMKEKRKRRENIRPLQFIKKKI